MSGTVANGIKDLRRRMILAPTPRERERWYALLLLAQGLTATAAAVAQPPLKSRFLAPDRVAEASAPISCQMPPASVAA